jgi:ABC-type antimicrobial peptide transport system permease subunit
VGVYSIVSYTASQRTHEMGVRIALGARLNDLIRLVMGEGLTAVAVGALVGIGISLALGRLIASLLYGVTPRDPMATQPIRIIKFRSSTESPDGNLIM